MYCVGVRLWPCKRSLAARAGSLRTPALHINTPPYSLLREITTPTLSVTLAAPSRRLFSTAPPADPSPHAANREVDTGKDRKQRPASKGGAQAEDTRSAGDGGGEEHSSAAAEVGRENEDVASSSPLADSEKPHQLHPATAQNKQRQPQPRKAHPDTSKTKGPQLSSRAVAMIEFAALERKLAADPAPPEARPTAGPSLGGEVTANNTSSSSSSSNSSDSNGNGKVSSSDNVSKEKTKTAEQVAMEEFAALERKLGSTGSGSQGTKERAISRNPRPSAAAMVARPKVSWFVHAEASQRCGGWADVDWIVS